jgi:hypothetical protein
MVKQNFTFFLFFFGLLKFSAVDGLMGKHQNGVEYSAAGSIVDRTVNNTSGVEMRGIEPVPLCEREMGNSWNNLTIWFSVNTVVTYVHLSGSKLVKTLIKII